MNITKSFLNLVASILVIPFPKIVVFYLVTPILKKIIKVNYDYGPMIAGYFKAKFLAYVRSKNSNETVLTFTTYENYKICLPVSDNHLFERALGIYHPGDFMNFYDKMLESVSNICEIGTHLGELTLHTANRFSGEIYAFEIDRSFYQILNQSLELNGFKHVVFENMAVGEKGKIKLGNGYCDFLTTMENFPTLNVAGSLNTDFFTKEPKDWDQGEIKKDDHYLIERIDLFDYFAKSKPIELFFMDIEGSEVYVIPMIIKLGKKWGTRPKIVFEIHHYAYSGEQTKMLRELLLKNGYTMTSPDERHVVCI